MERKKENVLISACLIGVNCRFKGDSKRLDELELLLNTCHLIPVCPETLGGLSTPRDPSERVKEKVVSNKGTDVTAAFEKGAEEVLTLAKLYHCKYAIFKENSPSCGSGTIYDGSFSKQQINGDGVCSELLKKHGITIYGESELNKFIDVFVRKIS